MFQLEVYYKVDRILTGLTVQRNETKPSNSRLLKKMSIHAVTVLLILPWIFSTGKFAPIRKLVNCVRENTSILIGQLDVICSFDWLSKLSPPTFQLWGHLN